MTPTPFHGSPPLRHQTDRKSEQACPGGPRVTAERSAPRARIRVGRSLGVNQMAGAAGFLLGPVVGGLLTAISWRWVFLFNVPLGILGTVLAVWPLREPASLPAHQRFDWLGSVTFVLGLGSLLLGVSLVSFPLLPSPVVTGSFVVVAVGLIGFLFAEVHVPQPMLDLIGLLL